MEITKKIVEEHGISEDEYELIKKFLGRTPNINELGVFSVMWSEHCGYKNTRPLLKTLPTENEAILQGPGENAGIVDIGGDYAIVFKVESHNHPSAVEPYQGAATGVGGILRDIFTMGARPIAMLDGLRFGKIESDRTKHLIKGVVKGVGDYGNCVGVPTVAGDIYFDESYEQNILVNAMCVGIIKKDKITKAYAEGVGNLVVYYGATTGRDGIHGATFASEELSEDNDDKRPSVQVGDPFTEKLLMEATLELIEKKLLVGVQDMGAAGLTSSSSEMASRGGVGIDMELDNIPKRADDLTPYEMLLSESQERMLAVVEPSRFDEVKKVLDKWDLHCVVIGSITDTKRLIIKNNGECVADIPVNAITDDVPTYTRYGIEPDYIKECRSEDLFSYKATLSNTEILKKLLDSPNIANKSWAYNQYDYMVRTDTITPPGDGESGVIRIKGTNKAVATTIDGNGRYGYLNPYNGAAISIAESYRNIVCSGGRPLAVTNCLNFANPEKANIYWQLEEAIKGIKDACSILDTPVTGGNCSMYNESGGKPIYPTVVIGMVGVIDDISTIRKSSFTSVDEDIFLIGDTKEEIGGSEYLEVIFDKVMGDAPSINLKEEKANGDAILTLLNKNFITCVKDISEGGLATAISEMSFNNRIGAEISYNKNIKTSALLFGESQGRYIFTSDKSNSEYVKNILDEKNIPYSQIGRTKGENDNAFISINELIYASVDELKNIFDNAIENRLNQ